MENICFIDFETTGINLIKDYPIEIAAVVINKDFIVLNEFHSYIKPNGSFKIGIQAQKIHGITIEKIQSFPTETTVLNEMSLKLGTDYRLASWNMSFDVAFFKMLCYRNDFITYLEKINYRHIDVQSISYLAKKMHLIDQSITSLSDFSIYLGLQRSKKHNALEDVKILIEVYKYLLARFKELI